MKLEINKPWRDASADEVGEVPCTTGVYELRRPDGEVVDIGYAGSREPFGLRSKIRDRVTVEAIDGLQFRCECHVQYMTRYIELVLVHRALHGSDPIRVTERPIAVKGHLSPDLGGVRPQTISTKE